jgi:hypothetical protein
MVKSKKVASSGRREQKMPESHEQEATSMPGSLRVIQNVSARSGGISGIPGIISSTTQGAQVRQRLVMGVIDSLLPSRAPEGPVSKVGGMDATAYNTGMVHLRGSPYTMNHSGETKSRR